jgi:hypothetical protein
MADFVAAYRTPRIGRDIYARGRKTDRAEPMVIWDGLGWVPRVADENSTATKLLVATSTSRYFMHGLCTSWFTSEG